MPELIDVQPNDPIEDEWGNTIRDRTIQRYDDRTTRTSEHPTPVNGDLSYLENEKVLEFYDGSAWVGFLPAGTIVQTGRSTAPSGWLLCQGQAVSRTGYATLFAAISTTYGNGDGSTTFNLPDLRQRFPLGKASSGTGQTLGSTGGSINHTHTGPSHSHSNPNTNSGGSHAHSTPNTNNSSINEQTGTANVGSTVTRGTGSANTLSSDHTHHIQGTHFHSMGNVNSGGSHAHSQGNTGSAGTGNTGQGNPPYLVVNFMIKH